MLILLIMRPFMRPAEAQVLAARDGMLGLACIHADTKRKRSAVETFGTSLRLLCYTLSVRLPTKPLSRAARSWQRRRSAPTTHAPPLLRVLGRSSPPLRLAWRPAAAQPCGVFLDPAGRQQLSADAWRGRISSSQSVRCDGHYRCDTCAFQEHEEHERGIACSAVDCILV